MFRLPIVRMCFLCASGVLGLVFIEVLLKILTTNQTHGVSI